MSTLIWIAAIYFFTVLVSMPFLYYHSRHVDDDAYKPYNPFFMATFISFIPVYNISESFI